MTEMTMENVLRRLIDGGGSARAASVGRGGAQGNALGGALARAAQETIGLPVVPRMARIDRLDREALIGEIDPAALLVGIGPPGRVTGLAAIEPQLRCAVVETQTLGAPRAAPAQAGEITGTEAAMMAPLLQGLLIRLAQLDDGPQQAALAPGPRLGDARAAGLILPEGGFAVHRFSMEIRPGSGREGALMLALALPPAVPQAPEAAVWKMALRETVLQASADLTAILHRMRLPAHEVEAFEPGQRLMLPGVSLSAIDLEDGGGRAVAKVRLGQFAGLRAVRLAQPEAASDALAEGVREIPARPARRGD
ncbi:hypothetical protein [Limimaricola cinnabarinus]|uniref:hypothetical protein n=1 Tax=Limimaricola cinnabarinus TaxID=1125964 RepID=UPI00249319E3|nr:hypothetical protein [Limimaricola cinnabarinus]